eukprot:UN31324
MKTKKLLEEKFRCLIPVGVASQIYGSKLSNTLITKHIPEIYQTLDNKAKMIDFKFVTDPKADIPQIPTLYINKAQFKDTLTFAETISKKYDVHKFIWKPALGVGAKGQIFKTLDELKKLKDVFSTWPPPKDFPVQDHVMQPCFMPHRIESLDFCAKEGKMVGAVFYSCGEIGNMDQLYTGYKCQVGKLDNPIFKRIDTWGRDFIAKYKLDGLMGTEFLNYKGNLFLMEINP